MPQQMQQLHSSHRSADPNIVQAAIRSHQHAVCAAAQQELKDICWFNQMPYEVAPGLRVSHSPGENLSTKHNTGNVVL